MNADMAAMLRAARGPIHHAPEEPPPEEKAEDVRSETMAAVVGYGSREREREREQQVGEILPDALPVLDFSGDGNGQILANGQPFYFKVRMRPHMHSAVGVLSRTASTR